MSGAVTTGHQRLGSLAQANVHAISLQCALEHLRVSRVIVMVEPVFGVYERHRHAVARVDLGQLDTSRTTAQDEQALGQLARRRRLSVGPRFKVIDAGQVERYGRMAAYGDDQRTPADDTVRVAVGGHTDRARSGDRGMPADEFRPFVLE